MRMVPSPESHGGTPFLRSFACNISYLTLKMGAGARLSRQDSPRCSMLWHLPDPGQIPAATTTPPRPRRRARQRIGTEIAVELPDISTRKFRRLGHAPFSNSGTAYSRANWFAHFLEISKSTKSDTGPISATTQLDERIIATIHVRANPDGLAIIALVSSRPIHI